MWLLWQLVLCFRCIFGNAHALDTCNKIIDEENLNLVQKIEIFLNNLHQSRNMLNACDKKYVNEFLAKTDEIDFNVPHVIKTSNGSTDSDDVLSINGEAIVTFYPERVFIRKKQFSTSILTVKSNFQKGRLNGLYFSLLILFNVQKLIFRFC